MPAMPATPNTGRAAARSPDATYTARVRLAAIGVAVYALALLATLPARLVLPGAIDAAGTVWGGEAAFGGGHIATWHWSLIDSLARFGVAGRWTIDGPGTALHGRARWRPFAGVDLDTVAGRAGWPLVALAAPSLPFACDFGFIVELDRAALGPHRQSGAGSVQGGAGSCATRVRGDVRAVPRVVAEISGNGEIARGVVFAWANRALHLADFTIERGILRLHTTPRGAALIPGSTGPSDVEIEL